MPAGRSKNLGLSGTDVATDEDGNQGVRDGSVERPEEGRYAWHSATKERPLAA